jgi:hypothetical protein
VTTIWVGTPETGNSPAADLLVSSTGRQPASRTTDNEKMHTRTTILFISSQLRVSYIKNPRQRLEVKAQNHIARLKTQNALVWGSAARPSDDYAAIKNIIGVYKDCGL